MQVIRKLALVAGLLPVILLSAPQGLAQDLEARAAGGDAAAQFELGRRFERGDGVSQSDSSAVHWFRQAAEQGHGEAQYNLAWMYANGYGVEKDLVKAHFWFTAAEARQIDGAREQLEALRRDMSADDLSLSRDNPAPSVEPGSAQPAAPVEDVNLASMATLRDRFGRHVGFSDHTIGAGVAITAAAMGAVAIEKHFTDDMTRPGPDHRFSATPDILKEIAEGVRLAHVARGSDGKVTAAAEQGNRDAFRRSAFALRALKAGEVLTPADYRFVRPNAGVPVSDKPALIDRALARDVRQYDPITYEDLAPK